MEYYIKLVSRIERENRIKSALAAATTLDEREFFDFRSERRRLKVVRLDVGLPVYRLENCRTYTAQEEYAARNNFPADYFINGQENDSVQQIQHKILIGLAKSGTESVVPIIEVLKKEGQREEILITITGVVVNGNRRLAAIRELYAESPADYASFSHVNCLVLPEDATPSEILDVEASLQAKQETKLDYDWIGDCKLISKLLESNGNTEAVARKLHRKEAEIKNSLRAFTEAQLYLAEWVGKPKEYSLVKDDGEQFFNDLPRALNGKNRNTEDAARAIGWVLFENRRELPGRLYNFNSAVGRRAEDVLDRVSSELGVDTNSVPTSGGSESPEFPVDFNIGNGEKDYNGLVGILKDKTRKEEVAETVIEVCQCVIESERDRNDGMKTQRQVIAALARLMEVELATAAPSTYQSIHRHLDLIATKATELEAQLTRFQAHQTAKKEKES